MHEEEEDDRTTPRRERRGRRRVEEAVDDSRDDVDAIFMVMSVAVAVAAVWPCSVLFLERLVGWLSIGSHHIFADEDHDE